MKDVRIKDFLTVREIKLARAIYDRVDPAKRNAVLVEKVIKPNLARIYQTLNSAHSESFLAYAIEHTFLKKPGYVRKHKCTPKGFGRSSENAYNDGKL